MVLRSGSSPDQGAIFLVIILINTTMKTFKLNSAAEIANFQANCSMSEVNKLASFCFNDFVDIIVTENENKNADRQKMIDRNEISEDEIDILPVDFNNVFENMINENTVRFFVRGNNEGFEASYSIGWWNDTLNQYEYADSELCELSDIQELFEIDALVIDTKKGMCQYDQSYDENNNYCPLFIEDHNS